MHPSKLAIVSMPLVVAALSAWGCGSDSISTSAKQADTAADAEPSSDAAPDAPSQTLACGVTVPTTYESAGYEANTAVEVALESQLKALLDKIKTTEGASVTTITSQELTGLFDAGSPSLRATTTAYYVPFIEAAIADLGAVQGTTWAPTDPPPATGGKYGAYYFSAAGLDLRQVIEKGMYGSMLYSHALSLTKTTMTEATIDRLVAIFGATPRFTNTPSADAGADADAYAAAYAARRDDKSKPTGMYRSIKTALLTAKAAIAAGDRCNAERDEALGRFFLEWERSNFATVVFYLNRVLTKLSANTPDVPSAMHDYGEAVSFVHGFHSVPTKKVTDAQIEALLTKLFATPGAPTSYELATDTAAAATQVNGALADIAQIYGFSDDDMAGFKLNFE